MVTITTKYHGPTLTRGSRIKATASSGPSVTVGYDYALDSGPNHDAAARKLIERMGAAGTWHRGPTSTGYVYVLERVRLTVGTVLA